MTEAENPERRRQKRIPFIKEVEVVGVATRRCSDLSVHGMYLETVHTFSDGTQVDLRFKLNDSDPAPIKVKARVLYRHEGVGVGLGFVNLSRSRFLWHNLSRWGLLPPFPLLLAIS
jgi:hypothetical protein